MSNNLQETLKQKDWDKLKIIIGGYCYAQDGGCGGYDFEEVKQFIIFILERQHQADMEEVKKVIVEEKYKVKDFIQTSNNIAYENGLDFVLNTFKNKV